MTKSSFQESIYFSSLFPVHAIKTLKLKWSINTFFQSLEFIQSGIFLIIRNNDYICSSFFSPFFTALLLTSRITINILTRCLVKFILFKWTVSIPPPPSSQWPRSTPLFSLHTPSLWFFNFGLKLSINSHLQHLVDRLKGKRFLLLGRSQIAKSQLRRKVILVRTKLKHGGKLT